MSSLEAAALSVLESDLIGAEPLLEVDELDSTTLIGGALLLATARLG